MDSLSPKVSIIIPVFNIEDYLPATLDSVHSQDYQNLEVLLIDDGSTDRSGVICDRFCEQDSRFHVFHIPNGGVSSARNFALDHITSEYCMFIDSDDLVKSDYVQAMVAAAQAHSAALVTCNAMIGDKHPREEFVQYKPTAVPAAKEISIDDYTYTNQYHHETVWGMLCRTDLIQDLRFDSDLYVGEDTVFFSRLLRRARRFVFIDETYYYYTVREGSLAKVSYNRRRYTEILAWERICSEAQEEDPVFINECYTALAIRCRNNYEDAIEAKFRDQEILDSLLHRTWELRENVYRSPYRTAAEKMKYALFLRMPKVFTVLKLRFKFWR